MLSEEYARAYDKKVKPRSFTEGDLVLKKILSFNEDPQEMFKPNYVGSLYMTKNLSRGALYLPELNGDSLPELVSLDSARKYFV